MLAALLIALGLAMIGAAVWLVKATRTDVPALGPLEIVGDRRFARRDAESQAAALAAARPEGALGPAPMVEIEDDEPALVEPAAESVEPPEPVEQAEPVDAVDAVEPAVDAGDGDVVADEPVAAVADAAPVETAEAVHDDAEANEPAEAAPHSS